jgi:RND family efflux transporter MFP subunit
VQIATPRLGHRTGPSVQQVVGALAAAVVIGGAGTFAYQRFNPAPAAAVQQTAQVTRGNLTSSVNATGTAAATTISKLTFESNEVGASAGRVSEVLVSVGDSVHTGQVLARLDTEDLTLAVRQAQSAVTTAQARLQEVLTGSRPEDVAIAQTSLASAQAKLAGMQTSRPEEITAAQAALDAARSKLAIMHTGSRPEEIAAAQAALASAQANMDRLQAGPENSDVVAAQSSLDSAQANLANAQAKLAELMQGPLPADVATAQSAVESARANLASAEVKLEALASPTGADVTAAQSTVENARSTLASAESRLNALLTPSATDIAAAERVVSDARFALDDAQLKLDQGRRSASAADVAAAEAAVASAQSQLQSALVNQQQVRGSSMSAATSSSGSVSSAALQQSSTQQAAADAAVTAARASLESAQQKLADLRAGPSAEELAPLQAAIQQANLTYRNAQLSLDALRNPNASEVAAARAAVASAQSGLTSAQARLGQLTSPNSSDLAAAQDSVAAARSQVASSELKLQQVMAGATSAELAAARTAVDSAEASVRSAEAKFEQTIAGVLPADLAAAQSTLIQAQTNLELKLNPYTAADIAAQQQAVVQAEANLATKLNPSTAADLEAQRLAVQSAQATLALKQNPYQASDILSAQASVEDAQTKLATAQKNLAGATVTAPFDGMVSAVAMAAGESAGSSSTITIVDPNRVSVDVQVDEADIARIAVGQPVNVTFDALTGRRFPGSVRSVSPSGTTTQGVVGYLVGIDLANSQGVRPGMTATAQLVTGQREDVLIVPNRALTRATGASGAAQQGAGATGQARAQRQTSARGEDGAASVQAPGQPSQVRVLAADGSSEIRAIRIGLANDQSTEVISGLDEGEQVVLPTTTARASVPGAGNLGTTGGFGAAPAGAPRF